MLQKGLPTGGRPGQNVWEEALGRALRTAEEVYSLLDAPEAIAERRVGQLEPEILYLALKELGLEQGAALLALASPEQVRCLFDLDCWWKDRFEPHRFELWLKTLFAEASDEKLRSIVRELDPELLCLFLKRHFHIRVKQPDSEDGSADSCGDAFIKETPDGWFEIVSSKKPPGDEALGLALRLVDLLYDCDRRWAETVLFDTYSRLSSELEEEAYRLKKGRLADRGFVDYYDALDILEPASTSYQRDSRNKPRHAFSSGLMLSPPLARALSALPFLNAAMSDISDPEEIRALEEELVILFNKVLAVEQAARLSMGGIRRALERACGLLNIGLQTLSYGDLERARALLREEYLQEIFRAGRSSVMRLRSRAREILQGCPPGRLSPRALLEPHLCGLLKGLLRFRPVFYRGLNQPDASGYSSFVDIAQVELADQQLERIRFRCRLFFKHLELVEKMPPEGELFGCNLSSAAELSFPALFATGLANQLLHNEFTFKPITASDLSRFVRLMREQSGASHGNFLERKVAAWLCKLAENEQDKALAIEFVSNCFEQLGRELENISPDSAIDPRYITMVLVRCQPGVIGK